MSRVTCTRGLASVPITNLDTMTTTNNDEPASTTAASPSRADKWLSCSFKIILPDDRSPSQDRLRPRQLSPKTGSRISRQHYSQRNSCCQPRFETIQRSTPERRSKARARDRFYAYDFLAFARVRALWWDSSCASNAPRMRHPALRALLTYCSHEYRERNKHTDGISGCQRDRKKRLPSFNSRFFYAVRFRTRPQNSHNNVHRT